MKGMARIGVVLLAITAAQLTDSQTLSCTPSDRKGRRLGARWKPVLPSDCLKKGQGHGRLTALCDLPGADYPWEAIDNYLRRSGELMKKHVDAGIPGVDADWSYARQRRGRAADITTADVTEREENDVTQRPGNWESSGDIEEDIAAGSLLMTDVTSSGDSADLHLTFTSIDGSGSEGATTDGSVNGVDRMSDDEEMAILVSFFTNNASEIVSKEAMKDMLQFRQTFERPAAPKTPMTEPPFDGTADDLLAAATVQSDSTIPSVTSDVASAFDTQRYRQDFPSEVQYYRPIRRKTTTHSPAAAALPAAGSRRRGAPAVERAPSRNSPSSENAPHAELLVARPPNVVEFNRKTSTFPARRRVAQAAPRPPPAVRQPQPDDFTETVYATAIYRQPGQPDAARAPVTERTRSKSTTTMTTTTTTTAATTTTPITTTTPDPYTESACQYDSEVRSPFYAMNTRNEWKTLINMPIYETFIYMEHCVAARSRGRCSAGCRCTQKYTVRTMPVYDTDINGCDIIYMDKFLFPSHCDCKCRPVHLLFTTSARPAVTPVPPSSESPEKVNFVDQLTEAPRPTRRSSTVGEEAKAKATASTLPMRVAPPATSRPGVPSHVRRRPGVVSRATVIPRQTRLSVPPQVPIVPSDAPVLNRRNRFRGPQKTTSIRRTRSV